MKTVLITGATSGFGHGLVKSLLQQGFQVIATGRNLTNRPEVFKIEREKFGSRLVEKSLDLSTREEIDSLARDCLKEPLFAVVNNAGFGFFGPIEESSEERIRYQFEVNFFGLVSLTQKLLPALKKSQGHVINFSSVMGLTGFPFSGFYCASKFAVEGFSESLAIEMKAHGVKVSIIEPGGYPTKFSQSMEWTADISGSSYTQQVKNFKKMRDRMEVQRKMQNPQDVVDGVCRILQDSNPKVAYLFGFDAWFTRILQRSLPREIYFRIFSFALNRVLNKN